MGQVLPLLVAETGLSQRDILRIVVNAPVRYKSYSIPKRNGGQRLISQPAREVKSLQRIVAEHILAHRPIHPSATAYREGMSIKANAAAHVQNGPILKLDFKDFFPSITDKDWLAYCERYALFSDQEDIAITRNILFHKSKASNLFRLAIGAPSSPLMSNLMMYDFDTKLSDLVSQDQVTYTRYADDLTFSAKRTGFLTRVREFIDTAIKEVPFPSLTINNSKTVLATPKYKRMVTGLILTNDGKVSIGSRRKRKIRAAMHHYVRGRLDIASKAHLAGMVAFINDVEPEFLARLRLKYGENALHQLRFIRLPSRFVDQQPS